MSVITRRINSKDHSAPGYFRIGDVVLDIPPTNISIERRINNEELVPVRGKYPFFRKTGHMAIDVRVSWMAIQDTQSVQNRYSQWLQLRRVYAMFVAAPFVEVENAHLRQLILNELPDLERSARMAFALRQFRVETVPDAEDALRATLLMSFFNYDPYSPDFAYVGDGRPANADESKAFSAYLDYWISKHIVRARDRYETDLKSVDEIFAGEMNFLWRDYVLIPGRPEDMAPAGVGMQMPDANRQPVSVSSRIGARKTDPRVPTNVLRNQMIIRAVAKEYGLDETILLSLAERESGFREKAQNPSSTAKGLFQLLDETARQLGVTDPFDPEMNARGGALYFKQSLQMFNGDVRAAIASHYWGPGNQKKYGFGQPHSMKVPGTSITAGDVYRYVDAVLAGSRKYAKSNETAEQLWAKINGQAVFQTVSNPPGQAPARSSANQAGQEDPVEKYSRLGFQVDHRTDSGTFMFRENRLHLCSEEYGCTDNHVYPNPAGMVPFHISITWQNRLAPIPLAGAALPTYQHCGPPSTRISISFLSNGDMSSGEPVHPGAMVLSAAVAQLESQTLAFKGMWKAVSSFHRMQSLLVENEVLSFFGIYGLIVHSISTDTVEESPNLLQVQLEASQYENVFEQLLTVRMKNFIRSFDVVNKMMDMLLENKNGERDRFPAVRAAFSAGDDPVKYGEILHKMNAMSWIYLEVPENIWDNSMQRLADEVEKIGYRNIFPPELHPKMESIKDPEDRKTFYVQDFSIICYLAAHPKTNRLAEPVVRYILKQMPENKEFWRNVKVAAAVTAAANNPAVMSEVQQMERDPAIRKKINLEEEDSHIPGTYFDLGLSDEKDMHPAQYFEDEQKKINSGLFGYMQRISNKMMQALGDFKSSKNLAPPADIANSDVFSNELHTRLFHSVRMSQRSMKQAFPACRLYMFSESSDLPVLLFDDFFAHNAVLDYEVIRYKDKPDMLVIRVSNDAGLLRHRLFDGSVSGVFEKKLARAKEFAPAKDSENNTEPVAVPAGVSTISKVDVTYSGEKISRDFRSSGNRFSLNLFPLQVGTKIELRAGYENDPDKLFPVFGGLVTAIEEGSIMTITAQGFVLELMDSAPDEISHNGVYVSSLGSFVSGVMAAGREALQLNLRRSLKLLVQSPVGPAYGGTSITGPSGLSTSVIREMLKVSTARHWGGWKSFLPPDVRFLRGYSLWQLLPKSDDPGTVFGKLISTGYNRVDENLVVNFRGSIAGHQQYTGDAFYKTFLGREETTGLLPAEYFVPNDPSITPWRIIQDIRRRIPSHLLLPKHYGFPYDCAATLVYASPFDFYYSRYPYFGEEMDVIKDNSPETKSLFMEWWNASGRTAMLSLFNSSSVFTYDFKTRSIAQIDRNGKPAFDAVIDNIVAEARKSGNILNVTPNLIWVPMRIFDWVVYGDGSKYDEAFWRNVQLNADRLRSEAIQYIKTGLENQTGKSDYLSGRLKPVRKTHLVTNREIMHNGIELNGSIFNTVRISNENISAHASISAYRAGEKVLDVDKAIIDVNLNVVKPNLVTQYAQSFLKEELGKMYRGELILRGNPEIEPGDIVYLFDMVNDMIGPVEAESVIHQFDPDLGFTTIVRPALHVAINDLSGGGLAVACQDLLHSILPNAGDLLSRVMGAPVEEKVTGAAIAAGVGAAGYIGLKGLTGTVAALGAGAPSLGVLANPYTAAAAVVALAVGFFMLSDIQEKLSPVFIVPLMRSGYPWVAGIDGWEEQSLSQYFFGRWQSFYVTEIAPYVESARDAWNVYRMLR